MSVSAPVSEIVGLEEDVVIMPDILIQKTCLNAQGNIQGRMRSVPSPVLLILGLCGLYASRDRTSGRVRPMAACYAPVETGRGTAERLEKGSDPARPLRARADPAPVGKSWY